MKSFSSETTRLAPKLQVMKFDELKAQVYELAEVSTTPQLKSKYEAVQSLDMRRKASWQQALTIVQNRQREFQDWLENPPDKYKELFTEIRLVSQSFDDKLVEAKQLAAEVNAIADSLEDLAQECQDEADSLKQEVKAAQRVAKQAELN